MDNKGISLHANKTPIIMHKVNSFRIASFLQKKKPLKCRYKPSIAMRNCVLKAFPSFLSGKARIMRRQHLVSPIRNALSQTLFKHL